MRKRKLAWTVGTSGLRGWSTSDTPVAVNVEAVAGELPGELRAELAEHLGEVDAGLLEDARRSSITRDRPPPPPGRSQVSSRKRAAVGALQPGADAVLQVAKVGDGLLMHGRFSLVGQASRPAGRPGGLPHIKPYSRCSPAANADHILSSPVFSFVRRTAMRYALVLTAAMLFAPSAVRAADPPITFQSHSFERVLNDIRFAADLVGGEKAVKAFNDGIKAKLGERVRGAGPEQAHRRLRHSAPKPADITAVIAFPITGEKGFIALCDRWNGGEKAKDLGKGIWQVPPLDPRYKARMKFSDGYAYIAYGAKSRSRRSTRKRWSPRTSSTIPRSQVSSRASSTSTASQPM